MIIVERFVNELMTSNCYIVVDEASRHCICIDPASEKSLREISYIEDNGLTLDYIIITHEHTDHNWGVNSLKEQYPQAIIVCSELCNKNARKSNRAYFLFYYDDSDYSYEIEPAEKIICKKRELMKWYGHDVTFLLLPGHSYGSMSIEIAGMLFTGDTIMPFKPYLNGRDSNEYDYKISVSLIIETYYEDTMIYPGHGDILRLGDWIRQYNNYI